MIEQTQHTDELAIREPETGPLKKREWQEITIEGRQFLAMQGLTAALERSDQEKATPFTYDEYRHPESGMTIQVWKLGMERPITQPAPARIDYGCPCMQVGPGLHLVGHECAAQRQMMFQTIAEIGIGAIATVSEETSAGNGHGSHAVMQQSDMQYKAMTAGTHVPDMREAYENLGFYPPDVRRHSLVASVLAHSIGTERPIIPTTANSDKIAHLKGAGLNVVDGVRVELVTKPPSRQSADLETSRRRGQYAAQSTVSEPGPYLAVTMINREPLHVRLTRSLYERVVTPAIQAAHRSVRRSN